MGLTITLTRGERQMAIPINHRTGVDTQRLAEGINGALEKGEKTVLVVKGEVYGHGVASNILHEISPLETPAAIEFKDSGPTTTVTIKPNNF